MVMVQLIFPIVALALFALLAARFGCDSRDGPDTPPQPPLGSTG